MLALGQRCDLVCLDLPRAQALRGRLLPASLAERTAARPKRVRRARLLAWGGVAWHGLELAIALAAGIAAGSITLIGFGADSLIEALAGGIVLWRRTPP